MTKLPRLIAIPAILAVAMLMLPLAALLIRVDWAQVPDVLRMPETYSALGLSLLTAAVATLPLVLPPLVGGLALLSLFGRGGLLGDWLLSMGIRIPFTTTAVILAQTFVALPFLVISVEGALRSRDVGYERVAESLVRRRSG